MEGLLVLLFLAYVLGWFLSFLGLFLSNAQGKKKFAMAHGYAIILLLLFSNLPTALDLSELMIVLSGFNFLAMTFFLMMYGYQLDKEKEQKNKVQKLITDSIIIDKKQ